MVCANRAWTLHSIQLELLLLFYSGAVQRSKITTKSLLDQGTKSTANTTHVLQRLVLSKHGVKGWITEKMEFRAVEEPSNESLDIYVVYVRNSVKMWTYTEKEFSKNFNEIYISKTTKVSNVSHFQKKKKILFRLKEPKKVFKSICFLS